MTTEKLLPIDPFIAELSAQLDRVASQDRRLIAIVNQQEDEIQVLLHEVGDLKTGQAGLSGKVDLILQLLQSGNGNGRSGE